MDEHDAYHVLRPAGHVAENRQSAAPNAPPPEREWPWRSAFTDTEWRRLVFMRWLYDQGRLTEYPHGHYTIPQPILRIWQDK